MADNKITANLMIALPLLVVSTIAAGNSFQPIHSYSNQLAGTPGNPWALPPEPRQQPEFKSPTQDRYYSPPNGSDVYTERVRPEAAGRYVTPEILQSLKQQQSQQQGMLGIVPELMPPRRVPYTNYNRRLPQQYNNSQLLPGYSGGVQNFGMPSQSGMGSSNPLFDVPSVSPWSNAPDVLYRGEDMPWLPDAALDGMPPIPISPYMDNYGFGGSDRQFSPSTEGQYPVQDNVFNPFTFAPGGKW